jgi:phage terminase Nu1 subunit (DNA packaging protein)
VIDGIHDTPTQADLAEILGISQQAVSLIEGKGIAQRDMTLMNWIAAYTSHLREIAAGRLASGDLDLASERARLAKEQADKIALQNAVTRRELAPVTLIEEVLAKAGSRVAGILDAIPGAIRRRMPELGADGIELISVEIAKARNIAAAVRLQDIFEEETADPDAEDDDQG